MLGEENSKWIKQYTKDALESVREDTRKDFPLLQVIWQLMQHLLTMYWLHESFSTSSIRLGISVCSSLNAYMRPKFEKTASLLCTDPYITGISIIFRRKRAKLILPHFDPETTKRSAPQIIEMKLGEWCCSLQEVCILKFNKLSIGHGAEW